jgi:hypothetical protein
VPERLSVQQTSQTVMEIRVSSLFLHIANVIISSSSLGAVMIINAIQSTNNEWCWAGKSTDVEVKIFL